MNFSKPSQVKPYQYFYSKDPALDAEAEAFDHARYRETGDAETHLPVKIGATPTVFTIRPITSKERYYLQQKATEGVGVLCWYAVAIALEAADPMLVNDEPRKLERVRDGSVTRLSDFDMELLSAVDDGALVAELAERILSEVSNPKK